MLVCLRDESLGFFSVQLLYSLHLLLWIFTDTFPTYISSSSSSLNFRPIYPIFFSIWPLRVLMSNFIHPQSNLGYCVLWSLLFSLHRPKILVPSFISFSHPISSSSKMSHKSHHVTSLLQCFPINSDKNPSLSHGFQGRIDSQHCSQTPLWRYCVSLPLIYLPSYHSWNIWNVIHLRAFALACPSDQKSSPPDVSMACSLTSSSHCWIFSHPPSTAFLSLFTLFELLK